MQLQNITVVEKKIPPRSGTWKECLALDTSIQNEITS